MKTVKTVSYEARSVQQTAYETPSEYLTDTDGDGLVDGIDPDPSVHQQEYFTDTDGDSVPNAFDLHHDADDFSYIEEATDTDGNGILDQFEAAFNGNKESNG